MEERTINEKESLELISQMIKQTKEKLNVGSGNLFLVWGYVCIFVGLAVYGSVYYTHDFRFYLIYFLIPLLGFGTQWLVLNRTQKHIGYVSNYTSKMVDNVWSVTGYVFLMALAICLYFSIVLHASVWIVFFILGLLLPGISCMVSGYVIKEKCLVWGGMLGVGFGVSMMSSSIFYQALNNIWNLIFSLCYLVMMVIPGHYLNHKAKVEAK